jgi:CRP-like cAMP-binding protein
MHYIDSHIELCLESPSSVFYELNQKDKEAIDQNHTIARIKKGGYLCREGDKARGLVCLASGKAKVFREGVAGREHIMKMMNVLDLIGFHSLFTGSAWSANVVAIEDSVTCTIEKNCLMRILRTNPDLSLKFSQILAEELKYSYDKMVSLTQKHVRGRLVESLLMLAEIYGLEDDGVTIRACFSRSDIAHLSNMTTSNAIRTLSNLVTEGNIKMRGRRISLLKMDELGRISEQA